MGITYKVQFVDIKIVEAPATGKSVSISGTIGNHQLAGTTATVTLVVIFDYQTT